MVLIEAYRMQLVDPSLAWLQVWVLFILLVWLCLFSSYVQAMRKACTNVASPCRRTRTPCVG